MKLKLIPRTSKYDIKNYRICPQNFIDKLRELRYSQNIGCILRYVAEYKPTIWLFEGMKGEAYSQKGIQAILKKSVEKVGIKKHIKLYQYLCNMNSLTKNSSLIHPIKFLYANKEFA